MANEIADDGTVLGDPDLRASEGKADHREGVEIVDGRRVRKDEAKAYRERHGVPAKKRAATNKSRAADVENK